MKVNSRPYPGTPAVRDQIVAMIAQVCGDRRGR
jgi:hypothetical protein